MKQSLSSRCSQVVVVLFAHLFPIATLSFSSACGDEATTTGGADTGGDGDATVNACVTSFDCSGATPYCRVTAAVGACLAPLNECTGDDPNDADDGPMAATEISVGASMTAMSCTGSGLERDWYRFSIVSALSLEIRVTWDELEAHFNPVLFDANGDKITVFDGGYDPGVSWKEVADLPAGTYFVEIDPNTIGIGEPDGSVAVAYSLTITAK